MSKIVDYIERNEKEIKKANIDLEGSKFGRIYKNAINKYKEYENADKELTEEQRKALKKYYLEQMILIAIGIILFILLVIHMIHHHIRI